MKTKTEVFYSPRAASELVGLTEERIVKLCEQIGAPVVMYRMPCRETQGVGVGGYLVPARWLERFGAVVDEAGREMLVRLSGEPEGEDRGQSNDR